MKNGDNPAGDPAETELTLLRTQALARIGSLQAELERLTDLEKHTRADLRRLLEDCLARLDGDGADRAEAGGDPVSAPVAAEEAGDPPPVGGVLQGVAGILFNPARRRLVMAGGWDQVPMLLVLALIMLQQLAPTIQRMALLG